MYLDIHITFFFKLKSLKILTAINTLIPAATPCSDRIKLSKQKKQSLARLFQRHKAFLHHLYCIVSFLVLLYHF